MLRLFSMLLLGMAVATACSSSPAPVEAAGALDAIGIQQADQVDLTNFLQVPVDATEDDPGPAVNEILLFTSLEEDLDGARLRYETRLRSEDGDTLVRTVAADVDPTGADAAWAVETDGLQFTTELFDQVRDENIGIWTVTVRGEIELVDDRIIPFNGRYEFAVVPPAGPERVPIVRPTPIPIPAATPTPIELDLEFPEPTATPEPTPTVAPTQTPVIVVATPTPQSPAPTPEPGDPDPADPDATPTPAAPPSGTPVVPDGPTTPTPVPTPQPTADPTVALPPSLEGNAVVVIAPDLATGGAPVTTLRVPLPNGYVGENFVLTSSAWRFTVGKPGASTLDIDFELSRNGADFGSVADAFLEPTIGCELISEETTTISGYAARRASHINAAEDLYVVKWAIDVEGRVLLVQSFLAPSQLAAEGLSIEAASQSFDAVVRSLTITRG